MSRLFYTDTSLPPNLFSISHHFKIETFVEGLGFLVGVKPPAVSLVIQPIVTSHEELSALVEKMVLCIKSMVNATSSGITLSSYISKVPNGEASLRVAPLIIISLHSEQLSGLSTERDASLAAVAELCMHLLKKLEKIAGGQFRHVTNAEQAFALCRSIYFASSQKPETDGAVLVNCLGYSDLQPYQRCILSTDKIGLFLERSSLPQAARFERSEELFACLIGEKMLPGSACKIDVYSAHKNQTTKTLLEASFPTNLEPEGLNESLASVYLHWDHSDLARENFGTFMEHTALRSLELSVLKEMAAASESIWTPCGESSSVLLPSCFPGALVVTHPELRQKLMGFLL